jgi:hypothetical protein
MGRFAISYYSFAIRCHNRSKDQDPAAPGHDPSHSYLSLKPIGIVESCFGVVWLLMLVGTPSPLQYIAGGCRGVARWGGYLGPSLHVPVRVWRLVVG